MEERIQKLLSRAGYGSRRELERLIKQGEIEVNGKIAEIGQKISPHDLVKLRGKALNLSHRSQIIPRVLLYNKVVGEVCTRNDPEGRKTIFDNLPHVKPGRWISVGRLDINTDGLILFTNDGDLANKLMHPSSEIEREYAVRVLGDVTDEVIAELKKGVNLEDGPAKFERIIFSGGEGANSWYHIVLKEGRNREVRRIWESVGLKVSRLRRIRFASLSLERGQRPGQAFELPIRRLRGLYESVGLPVPEAFAFSDQIKKSDQKKSSGRPDLRKGYYNSTKNNEKRNKSKKSLYSRRKRR